MPALPSRRKVTSTSSNACAFARNGNNKKAIPIIRITLEESVFGCLVDIKSFLCSSNHELDKSPAKPLSNFGFRCERNWLPPLQLNLESDTSIFLILLRLLTPGACRVTAGTVTGCHRRWLVVSGQSPCSLGRIRTVVT